VIWKANRAKTRIANKLSKKSNDLNLICKEITEKIYKSSSNKERLRTLMEEYKFRLPTKSAILAVLYPNDFSVYDFRVCESLEEYKYLKNDISDFEKLWTGYCNYLREVKQYNPGKTNFVDADRNLWGKSFYYELKNNIKTGFKRKIF
jgi:hypothetical protein